MLPLIARRIENFSLIERTIELQQRNSVIIVENTVHFQCLVNGRRTQFSFIRPWKIANMLRRFALIDFQKGFGDNVTMYKYRYSDQPGKNGEPVQECHEVFLRDIEFDPSIIHAICVEQELKRINRKIFKAA